MPSSPSPRVLPLKIVTSCRATMQRRALRGCIWTAAVLRHRLLLKLSPQTHHRPLRSYTSRFGVSPSGSRVCPLVGLSFSLFVLYGVTYPYPITFSQLSNVSRNERVSPRAAVNSRLRNSLLRKIKGSLSSAIEMRRKISVSITRR